MKKTITLLMILINTVGFSQSEPKIINSDDVIGKVDRSDIEAVEKGSAGSDMVVPKFEMPKIEFNTSIKEDVEKEVSEIDTADKNVNINTLTPKTQGPEKTKQIEITIVKKPLVLNEFRNNDKIVVSKGTTYVYRKFDKVIKQYTYLGKLDLESKALTNKNSNDYYVEDEDLFISDSMKINAPKVTKTSVKKSNKVRKRKQATPKSRQQKNKKKAIVLSKVQFSESELIERKKIEKDFNRGKNISETIGLANLRNNDIIYILGNHQIVIRKISFSSNKNRFWLAEKPDLNSKLFIKLKDNKYKVTK